MNNGGVSTSSENETKRGAATRRRSPAEDFGMAASKVAVAQICESVGFDSLRDSAMDSLADIAIRYLRDLGKAANFYANLAGRAQCNVFDIIRAVEDLGNFQGFSGASEVSQCIVHSGTVKEIIEYVETAEEIPFAQPLPQFPILRERRPIPSFAQMGEAPPSSHVPDWLPALPDSHTYKQSPILSERDSDPREDKIQQAKQRRKAEKSLLNLQQRLAFNGTAGASTSYDVRDNDLNEGQAVEGNPFLATPLRAEEKETFLVGMPDVPSLNPLPEKDNDVSVLRTFAPAIEAMKDQFPGDLVGEEGDDGISKVLPGKRPAVHFKLNCSKKVFAQFKDTNVRTQNVGRSVSLTPQNEERDDKKRRAEYILSQCMENPEELTQL